MTSILAERPYGWEGPGSPEQYANGLATARDDSSRRGAAPVEESAASLYLYPKPQGTRGCQPSPAALRMTRVKKF
jgi:hypothetical protein